MKGYKTENIRNIALIGHGGCGKTTFVEAALLSTGVINRLGRVEDGNTVSDYEKMEIDKKHSIGMTVVPVEHEGVKINFIDTPGFFDYVGEVNSALRAVGAAAILVDASAKIQVGTEKAWEACNHFGIPRVFVINKTDKEDANVELLIEELKEKFGNSVVTMDDKEALTEAIAETDEVLMEKFFDGEEFTDEEFHHGLSQGLLSGDIAPVVSCSSLTGDRIGEVLSEIIEVVPSPIERAPYEAKDEDGNDFTVKVDPNGHPTIFIFKTIADPFLGKISLGKVGSGVLKIGQELYNPRAQKPEKLSAMFFMRGKSHEEATEVVAGDVVAIAKLQYTKTGDTLCEKSKYISYPQIEFPSPSLYLAVEPIDKSDDEKMGTGLHKLMEEDPSFVLERNTETHQTLLGGQGEIQLNIVISKLKDRFSVDVNTIPQKIAYRETIKGTSDVQGKHKKQSGGAGQYGDVHIKFMPSTEEFEFTEELFGGSIPKNYVPAIEKGLIESLDKGPLAGCKVVNIKAVLYDGSYHDVDSNEMAFKIAAALAFKKGIAEAKPCLLEPIMKLEINIPENYMGDVMGDMNKRRGKILGMEPTETGQKLMAEAPQAELFDYAIALRSMTQARGAFKMDFERYEEVPNQIAQKIIEDYQNDK